MSRKRLQSDSKVCATCEYWCGERIPCDQAKKWVEFELSQDAKCMVRPNHRAHSVTPKCSKYQKLGWMK